jgi:hypothetical protein
LAKGKIRTDWSLYSIPNATSWVPVSVVYAGSGTITIAESDPTYLAWLPTYTAHNVAQANSNAYFESAKTNLTAQLATETNRAYAAETNLAANLAAETNRAYAAETNLTAQLATETNRA